VTGRHPDILTRFPFFWGQTVVSVVVDGTKPHDTFHTRAEYGIVVGFPANANGAVLLYIPARGSRRFFVRRDVRPIHFGPSGIFRSLEKLHALVPQEQPDGSVIFPSMPGTSDAYLQLCAAPWHPSHDSMDDSTVSAHSLTSSLWTLPDPVAAPSPPDKPPAPPDDRGPNYDRLLLTPQTLRPPVVAPEISPTNLASTIAAETLKRPLEEATESDPSLLEHPDTPAPQRPRREIHPPSRCFFDAIPRLTFKNLLSLRRPSGYC
jgi:hypothetical protein